jgi:hypothetical protein
MEAKKPPMESSLLMKSLALGVRYEPQYRVRDYMGTLIDAILHAASSPFSPTVFPYTEANPIGQDLFNPETENTLKVNQSDTVLEFNLGTTDLQTVSNLGKDFQTYVLEPLHKICGVSRIARYGVLVRFNEKSTSGLQRPTVRYKDPDLPVPKDFGVRFSHRLPTNEGYFRKNVSDYRNVIYSLFESAAGQISLSLDYQEYFIPMLEASEWSSHPFPSFVDEGIHYHRTTFTKWIGKLKNTEQAA